MAELITAVLISVFLSALTERIPILDPVLDIGDTTVNKVMLWRFQ